ncbi:MAG: hypothetical protein FJX72_00090 [Armatimonadetes bacterium]|nr:hypothetical protein [Armatimonadota bacterium]
MKRLALCIVLCVGSALPACALPLGFGIGIRLGVATTRPSGVLVGLDATIPTISLGRGMKTRFDFDMWGQPTSGWDRTSGGKAVAVCQIVDGIIGYYGAGIGYSRIRTEGMGHDGPELKLVSGMSLLGLGFEVNAHIGKLTVWTGMLRLKF